MSVATVSASNANLNISWFIDFCENAYDLIQCVGIDGRLLYVNRAWRETLGYSPEEVSELVIWDVISPECRPHCGEAFQKVIAGEPLGNVQVIYQTKAGQPIYLEGCATLCAEPGFPIHTRGIFRDITERKQIEQAREKLIAELQQALAEIRTLQGLLPMCAWCKRVRDDQDFWHSVEDYLRKHTELRVTHAMCPTCLKQATTGMKSPNAKS